jgi:hypothetical protein
MQKHFHAVITQFARILLALLVLLSNGFLINITVRSQETGVLLMLQALPGEITDSQIEQRWSFEASKGQRVSLRMQSTSGDLDPFVEMMDKDGNIVATGVSSSLRNATVDGIVIPETGRYFARASRNKAAPPSSGTYTLSLLPGYSFLLLNDPNGSNAPMRTFQTNNAVSHFAENTLEMRLVADKSYTWTTVADRFGVFKDLYMQTDIIPQPESVYWEAGLLVRGVRSDAGFQFYAFFVNSDGNWKLAFGQSDGLKTIQDWTPLPVPVGAKATLGMLVKETSFSLFINGQSITELNNDSLIGAGTFGVAIGSGKAPNNNTLVRFANFVVTLPAQTAASGPVIVPAKLTDWQRAQEPLLNELANLRLIPGLGKIGLEIKNKAFVSNNTALGISYQPLAESLSFSDLVYSADVTWESSNENTACALEVRAADDNNFTIVYWDRKGGYGIRQTSEKDGVTVSQYNITEAILKDNKATNRVTIIAIGNNLIVYINGVMLINVNVKQTTGGVRIAAYNYQRATNFCQFTNLWLRSFDH